MSRSTFEVVLTSSQPGRTMTAIIVSIEERIAIRCMRDNASNTPVRRDWDD